jgi:hypothetical protein
MLFHRKRSSRLMALVIVCLSTSGCMAASAALAMARSTDQFRAYAADPRVRYEPGAEEQARRVAAVLPAALQAVERAQYRDFVAPVTIYVCASRRSFKAYGAPSGREGGFVLNKRLFIGPKSENTGERLPRLLTHELSHLHIEQQTGLLRAARIPSWFSEGLAVYVAKGGGAETVTDDQARDALRHGRYFQPDAEGSVLFPKRAHDYGLTPHLFYREAALFVAFLAQRDPAAFRDLLLAVEDATPFTDAFHAAYRTDIADLWRSFLADASKYDNAAVPARCTG